MEEETRKNAIFRYMVDGESPKDIYTNLHRSKKWFFKWLKRFQSGDSHWYEDQSRAPLIKIRETGQREKDLILSTRQRLESEPFAQIGVSAIKWELKKLGLPFPSDSTINRILNREGLVKKNRICSQGYGIPLLHEALEVNNIHQMDLVGPRYIKGDGKFYALNVMDLYSHQVYLESQRTKADDQVAFSLMRCWKAIGMPDFLQMDNELSFRGSNRYPRSFGIVLQLCLYYGIQPIFIPVGEPWRNGTVERFNDTYSRKFFRRQWFHSYEALKRQSKNFQRFHNQHHRYSCLKGKTPMEVLNQSGYQPVKLAPNTKMPELDYIPSGNIILIRFIRSDRKMDVFGEKFIVSKDLIYSYVKAVIITACHAINVFLGDKLVETFEYRMPIEVWQET